MSRLPDSGKQKYWKLEKFRSGKMSAVATDVVKLADGTIPVFHSYQAARAYSKEFYKTYPREISRLSKRHKFMDLANEAPTL